MTPLQKKSLGHVQDFLIRKKIPHLNDDGELDFFTLSVLDKEQGGWLGETLKNMLAAFSEDWETGDPALKLEKAAAVLVAWSADIRRRESQKLNQRTPGTRVLLRVPEHQARFLGVIQEDGRIWVNALGRDYASDDILLLGPFSEDLKVSSKSVELQTNLKEELYRLQSKMG